MSLEAWLAFAAASAIMLAIPGPTILLVVSYALGHGRKTALATVSGVALGDFTAMTASLFGLGALLAASATLFTVLKWVGGAYLVWLGIQVWRSAPVGDTLAVDTAPRTNTSLFRQGLLSAVTNPKAVLFFAAFLPQFIDPARSLWLQFVLMAGTFALVEIATELFIASAAHRIRPWLQRVGKAFNRACGGVFMAIGVALPLRG